MMKYICDSSTAKKLYVRKVKKYSSEIRASNFCFKIDSILPKTRNLLFQHTMAYLS